jgi:LysR family cyn operon transcriptional activator
LQEIDLGVGELKAQSVSMSGVVRVGTTHTFNLDLIPDCVARFLGRHPTVRVVVEELPADAIAARLSGGELDLGIAYKPESHSELRFEPLFNEQLVLVVAGNHPLAGRKRIRMIELHHERLILLPRSFSTRQLIDECLAAAGAQPNVIAEMNTNAAMLSVVGRIHAATVVAANAVPAQSALVCIALESPTPIRTPGLLFSSSRPPGRTVNAFAALVRRSAAPLRRHGAR